MADNRSSSKTDCMDIKEIWEDFQILHNWTNSIVETECVEKCNVCCQNEIIWLTLPELLHMVSVATPEPQEYGCPFRTKNGCNPLVYPSRPLVCRTYGPKQYRTTKLPLKDLSISLGGDEYVLAGPGCCSEHTLKSSVNIRDLNRIYECYAELSGYGLVAIGRCKDVKTQTHVEEVCRKLQKMSEHKVYCPDGIPGFYNGGE